MLDSSRLGGGARRLVALAALLALTGCGPIAAGILLGTSSSSGSGAAPNTPPSVTVGAVASAASGAIDVPVVVKDAESHPVNLVVEVSIGGAAFAPASLVAGAPAPTALATSPAGTAYTFRWDSRKDVGPRDARGVQVRVTPYDASQGNTATATLDVLDNEPPVAAILTLSWDSTTGTGFVFYSLADSAADKSSVKVEYSLDGGATYKLATRATSAKGDATTGLDASVSGSVHTFAWDSRTDAPGVRNGNVFFRVTPSDALAGLPVVQGGLGIDNSVPPQITNVSGSVSGNVVTVTYTITDVVNDPVTVGVAFSADGGAYAPATGVAALLPDTSLSGQASSGAGVVHQLSWNATQAGLGNHVVTLQLTPTSTVTGAPAATPPLPISVSGNGPPSGTLAVVPRQDGGSATVPLTLTAQDPQGSNVSVVGSFSVNGGPVFAANFTGQTTGLSTAVVSSVHVLNWNAQADLAAHGYASPVTQNAVLALTLNNGVQSGLPVQTNGFTYGNAPPAVAIGALPPSASGVVALPFTLTDGTSDAATVTIDWRPSGSPEANGSYKTINVSVGSVTSLTTSPGGVAHSVGWNTLDTTGGGGVGLTNPTVVVRFKATDGLWSGVSPVQTASLAITNNQPSVATVQAIPRQPAGAPTQIPFTLYNAEGTNNLASDPDPITITVEYSLNGGPFATATGVSSTGPFSASPGGVAPPAITWNAAGDLGAATVSSNVVVRITPSDTYQTGASGVSAAFTVGDAAPVVSFDTVLSPQSGQVTFDFALSDSTADVCNVDFSFTINGTTTISSTTAVKPTLSPPGSAIASGYPGTATRQSMVWNAPADFAALGRTIANDSIVATVLISDSWGAQAVATTLPAFTLKSSVGAPSGTIAPVSRVAGTSTATFSLTAQDPQGLSVGLSGTFSVNGGTAYAATFQPPTTNLSTTPASNPQAVVWNAQTDLAAHGYVAAVVSNVVVTLVLDNGTVTSLPVQTNAFTFGNDAPVLSAITMNGQAAPTTSVSGVVPLGFLLSDSTADPSNVTVEWKLNGASDATYRPISVSVGSLVSLATSVGGTGQTVGWNTLATGTGGIGLTNQVVVLRFTPSDGLPGGAGTSIVAPTLRVQNNEPPVATVQAVTRVPLGQPLAISFTVFNSEGNGNVATDPDKVTTLVDVSTDGGVTYQPATNVDTTGPFTSLPSGWSSQFHWTPSQVAATTSRVVIRITPRDSVQTGAPGFSSLLTIGDDAPVASFDTVLSPQNGQVTFDFTLADSTADPCAVDFVFTIDGTTTISSTTTVKPSVAPSGAGLMSGFPGSAVAQTIVWNAPADFQALGLAINGNAIDASFVVHDAYSMNVSTVVLPTFTLASSGIPKPSLSLGALGSGDSAPRATTRVVCPYTIFDLGSLTCSIVPEFSLDGTTWFTARSAASALNDGATGLASSPGGTAHVFVWDALADAQVGTGGLATTLIDATGSGGAGTAILASSSSVRFRITPNDGVAVGVAVAQGPFAVGDDAPQANIAVAAGVQRGYVPFNCTLTDPQSDPCTVHVQFSTNGLSWNDATILLTTTTFAVGFLPNQASSPGGATALLTWSSTADLPASYRGSAWLRVQANDFLGYGAWAASPAFQVRNNTQPSVTIDTDLSTTTRTGNVAVSFTLTDASSDPCQLYVEYSKDGGTSWLSASTTTPVAGLPSSPTGVTQSFTWASAVDLPGQDVSGLELRLTPIDADSGATVVTPWTFRVDNEVPRIVSYTYRDLDGNGKINRVDVVFSERIKLSSVASAAAFQSLTGQSPTAFATPSGTDDTILQLPFGSEIPGTAPVDLTYSAIMGRITDLVGLPVATTLSGRAMLIDAAAPVIVGARATSQNAIVLAFSEAVTPLLVGSANVSTVFPLGAGATWLDGAGSIAGATWVSPSQLQVSLGTVPVRPTVGPGVTVSVAPGFVFDVAGLVAGGSVPVGGSFARAWMWDPAEAPSLGGAFIYDPWSERMIAWNSASQTALPLTPGLERWAPMTVAPTQAYPAPFGGGPGSVVVDTANVRAILFGDLGCAVVSLVPGAEESLALTLPGAPSERYGSASIYDPVKQRMVVFGGNIAATDYPVNETWSLSLQAGSESWQRLFPATSLPNSSDNVAVYDPVASRMVVLGGDPNQGSSGIRFTAAFDLSAPTGDWSYLSPAGTPPPFGYGLAAYDAANHRMVVVRYDGSVYALTLTVGSETWMPLSPPNGPTNVQGLISDGPHHRLIVCGASGSPARSRTWALDLTSGSEAWTELAVGTRPPAINSGPGWGVPGIYDPVGQRLVTTRNTGALLETHTYSLAFGAETWSQLSPVGTPPSERSSHTAIYDSTNGAMVIFGGRVGGAPVTRLSEVWALTLQAGNVAWTKLSPGGTAPPARSDHAAIYDATGQRMIVFGGQGDAGGLHDTWSLDLTSPAGAWTQLAAAGWAPPNVQNHSAIYDASHRRMIVFGGQSGPFSNATYAFDLATESWSPLAPTGTLPAARAYHGAAYDQANNQMLVFGGGENASRMYEDLWALDLTPGAEKWTLLSSGSPRRRLSPVTVFDALNGRLVIYGGGDFCMWWY